MSIVVTLYQLASLLGAVVVPSIETALKIKAAFESLGPEYRANIQALTDAAVHANAETIAKVNAWLMEQGFEPLPPDAAVAK